MIHVVATIRLAAGRRVDFLKEFHALVPHVHTEAGCLEYGPTVDVPTAIAAQGPVRDDVVTVMEKWESLEALEKHLTAPHMMAYREKVRDMVVGTELLVLEPAR